MILGITAKVSRTLTTIPAFPATRDSPLATLPLLESTERSPRRGPADPNHPGAVFGHFSRESMVLHDPTASGSSARSESSGRSRPPSERSPDFFLLYRCDR